MLGWVIDNWSETGQDGTTRSLTTYGLDRERERLDRLASYGFTVTGDHLMCRMERDLTDPDAGHHSAIWRGNPPD